MKMKSLAVLAASGLMAASLAAYATEANEFESFDVAMNDQPATSVENGMAKPDPSTQQSVADAGNANIQPGQQPGTANTNNADQQPTQGTPDVASGDDDY